MTARLFRLVPTGPSLDVSRVLAATKRRWRGDPPLAVALVEVRAGGNVATVFAGDEDGHFHQLASGIAMLRTRLERSGLS